MLLVFVVASSSSTLEADPNKVDPETWPGWRGVTRDGRVATRSWPSTLSSDSLKERFTVEAGPSYSTPVVAKDRVFITETRDKKNEVVIALDRESGKKLWEASWSGSMKVPFFARSNGSWIRATPAWDGERLYAAGMRDILVCLDGKTGKEVWRVDFVERFKSPVPSFGFVCSPLIDGDGVYVQAGAAFVKLDRQTGKTIWRSLEDSGGMYGSAFSSPVYAKIGGESQILVQTRSKLAGVRPDTGAALWEREIKAFRGMNILTPTVIGSRVFTSTYGGGTLAIDVKQVRSEASKKSEWTTGESWSDTTQGYMSSPVVVDGNAYLHLRNQRIACFRVADGKKLWTSRARFGKYVSFVTQGKQILGLDERGELLLIQPSERELKILDRKKIASSPTWAHLVVCGDEVFVRSLDGLTKYRWKRPNASGKEKHVSKL